MEDQAAAHAEATLPEAFVKRFRTLVPAASYASAMAAFARPVATGFRINPLRGAASAIWEALRALDLPVHRVPWYADAAWVPPEARAELLASAPYEGQQLYVQNLASMIPPLVLDPAPDDVILDLAAAPGSKTLQLAALMENQGHIAAVEVVKGRFFKLKHNLDAFGATNVKPFLQDGTRVWRYRPEYFDRVLLDAPCSTEGRFHVDDPSSYGYWSPRKIKEMARKQQRLLFSAVQCCKPGGVVVYSTCSFAPEENEAVLDKALRTFGDALHLEPLGLADALADALLPPLDAWNSRAYDHDLSAARRVLPSATMEGFFIARIRKTRSTQR